MSSDPQSIPAVLDRIARELPDHNALVTPDRTLTFAGLRDEVRRAAAAMIELGVGTADRVAIWSPNTWHWVVACLATHYAGATVVPLNTRYTAPEATDILARTGAPLLVAMGEFLGADKVTGLDRGALPDLRRIVRVPIAADDGTWDEFVAAGTDLEAADARAAAAKLKIPCIALFPYTDPKLRDDDGSEAVNPENLVCRAIRAIKKEVPEIGVLCDVALDPYTS
ncbi:MAG: AMP-binding protein, partial [Mycobacterium sp.]